MNDHSQDPTIDPEPSTPLSQSTPGDSRFLPGQLVDQRYRIVGLLGKGGMGEVYRADDLKLGQPVALKFLPEGLEKNQIRLERFLGEVRTARKVSHPNVCRVHDVGETGGHHFLSMEYVDGEDLASLLRRIGRVPQDRAVALTRQICAGLAAAHDQGILHRDLKPANIMIDGRGRARLTDFGLAGLVDELEGAEVRAGTPAYMAPEQLSGEEVSIQSDIYALGLVLYELFTGRKAFEADTLEDMKRVRLESPPSSPSSHLDVLDPAIERTILRCLEADPSNRPASVLAISASLPGGDPLAAALAAGETPSPELVAEAGSTESMKPAKAFGWVAAGLILLLVTAFWQSRFTLTQFMPMEKSPDALIDRARELIEDLGYTEPAYSDPVDAAWGFTVWDQELNKIRSEDLSADRWQQLTYRPDVVAFWYRQSPIPLYPQSRGLDSFAGGAVTLSNPLTITSGEIEILYDSAGRLRRFQCRPKRYSTMEEEAAEPTWDRLFELADLDRSRFEEVQPRYQRFFQSDKRYAWTGSRADRPDLEVIVEAGTFEDRVALFEVTSPALVASLSAAPQPYRPEIMSAVLFAFFNILFWLLVVLAIALARRNWRGGRADRRGATRLAVFVTFLTMMSGILMSHSLYRLGGFYQFWPIAASAIFWGSLMWLFYIAVEPFGRRTWPTIFAASSRLLSRSRLMLRDPAVGRSVLAGSVAGILTATAIGPLTRWLRTIVNGAPPIPSIPTWGSVVSQRRAYAEILIEARMGLVLVFFLLTILVVVLHMFKNRRVAVVTTAVLWIVCNFVFEPNHWTSAIVLALVSLFVLLRLGILACAVFEAALLSTQSVTTLSWSQWFAQPAAVSAVAVLALLAYGFWAATAGQHLFGEDS